MENLSGPFSSESPDSAFVTCPEKLDLYSAECPGG